MIKSKICEMLGIKYPVFQGGMAWVADASLAAAVSNAGGLGLISSINAGTEAVRNEIRKCKELTDKPFGVNIMLQAPAVRFFWMILTGVGGATKVSNWGCARS